MSVTAVHVPDMHCGSCVRVLNDALATLPGIERIDENLVRRQLLVTHTGDLQPAALMQRIEAAGFSPTLDTLPASGDTRLLKRLGVAGLAAMQVMMASIALYAGALEGMDADARVLFRWVSLAFCIPVVGYCATPFYVSALGALRAGIAERRWSGAINMDTPIAIAVVVAFTVSVYATHSGVGHVYFDSVAMFVFLLLLARYADSRLKLRLASNADAASALPELDAVPGDVVRVSEGATLGADGELSSATAVLDESVLTGEADWVQARAGDPVYAGTLNAGSPFELTVTATGADTVFAKISALKYAAARSKPALQRWADQVAGVFIPAVLAIAAATFAVWWWLDPAVALPAALAVLVISCPCALSLAVPAALSAAQVSLRRRGVVVTDADVLQRAARVTNAVFDKTGTLTNPEPRVSSVTVLGPWTAERCLQLAASAETGSAHPLARAFSGVGALPVKEIVTTPGAGVEALVEGHRVRVGRRDLVEESTQREPGPEAGDAGDVYLSVDGRVAARFEICQQVREDAAATIDELKDLGLDVEIASGDTRANVGDVASRLGIPFAARMRPDDKLVSAQRIQERDGRCLFVGDGVNDIPAMAGTDVSVAMLHASDLVRGSADVYLFTGTLAPVAHLVRIARRTRRIIAQNVGWAVLYNTLAIPAAAAGLITPWLAAFGMVTSSIGVMLNACRLLGHDRVQRMPEGFE